ncbi:MAG: hypothetical protein SH820_14755 [Xanthomonadales bacterium]|nr:hypothetical protein [Xanthomonadales bacterium]
MALPALIEVNSGPDRRLHLVLWVIWLCALSNLLLHASHLPLLLLLTGLAILWWSIPWRRSSALQGQRLQLHANGLVCYGATQGCWQPNIWRSRWYTVINIHNGTERWQAWVSAANNTTEDYRRLGVWSRFSPRDNSAAIKRA